MPTDADGNPDRSKIQFYLIFMILNKEDFAQQYQDEVISYSTFISSMIMLIVIAGFSLVLAFIILVTRSSAKRITRTITAIEKFTQELKTKTDLPSKKILIQHFSSGPLFQRISR